MLKNASTVNPINGSVTPFSEIYLNNGLEEEIDRYKISAINKIRFTMIIRPATISFIALIFSFFLDLSYVPLLGDVSIDLAKQLFPTWQPAEESFTPYSFWWLPVVVYGLFLFMAYLTYNRLKIEIARTPVSETIDRVVNSYATVIDSISTALPLIGAAVLLISIKLGEEVFLGLSVPFEIKALIVLAIGKLFEPVLDQLGVEFQNVVNHIKDIRERYFSRIQIENSKSLIKQLSSTSSHTVPEISAQDLDNYKAALEYTSRVSEVINKNFSSVYTLMEKLNSMQNLSPEKLQQVKSLADSITQASSSLSDEKTLAGLKALESIVKK
jgi:hypothetical protein